MIQKVLGDLPEASSIYDNLGLYSPNLFFTSNQVAVNIKEP